MELTAIAAWLNTAWAGFDQAAAVAVHQLYETAGGSSRRFWCLSPFWGRAARA